MKTRLSVTRISKCLYLVNGTKIDVRRNFSNVLKYDGVRQALMLYYAARNPAVKIIQLDRLVCRILNSKSWETRDALENGTCVF